MTEAKAANKRPWRAAAALAVVIVLAASLRPLFSRQDVHPRDRVASNLGWIDEDSCVDCHAEICASFQKTGHANTLTRAGDSKHSGLLTSPAPGLPEELTVEKRGDRLLATHRQDGQTSSVWLDWCFGSGYHAHTWIGLIPDSWGQSEQVEFRWTWYREIDGFALTPGQPASTPSGYFSQLGTLYDNAASRRCLSCHATFLPETEGGERTANVKAGVLCQRCHGPMQRHVQQARANVNEPADPFWKNASALESVNRCGQCHRRADEQLPGSIKPDDVDLARFQSVGLVQSECFKQSQHMSCMTCHDPHKPLAAQHLDSIQQCLQCHSDAGEGAARCAAGHRDKCLECHMPKVKADAPMRFTDHWIRVRMSDPGES